jgi:phage shock protein PspC (stress-responsive transcriptional regulator)
MTVFLERKKMSQLAKSKSKKMLFGVCGGLSNYTGIDVSVVRLLWFFGTIFTGSLLLWLYIILAIILPTDL